MKKHLVVLSCVLAGLLAGCGSAAPAAESSASAEASSTPVVTQSVAPAGPTSTPTPSGTPQPTSIRGNRIKLPGESAGLTYDGQPMVRFTVKSITVGAQCQYYTPKNGQIVVLDFDVETTAQVAKDPNKEFVLDYGWKAIAENGTTMNGNPSTWGCLDSSERLPQSFGPSEKATGKMAFDVPAPAGTLVFVPIGMDNGWEWSYPAK